MATDPAAPNPDPTQPPSQPPAQQDPPKRKRGRPRKTPPPEADPPGGLPPLPDPPAPPPSLAPEDRQLNERERRYVEEYLWDRVRTRAYLRSHPNADYRTARSRSSELHNRPHVRAEIDAATRAQTARCRVRADAVLLEISRIANSDVAELFDPHSNALRHPRHIPLDARRAIASVRVGRERRTVRNHAQNQTTTTVIEQIIEYKLWPKNDALGKLASYLGLSTAIPPLDALLAALPPALAGAVRAELAKQLAPQGADGDT